MARATYPAPMNVYFVMMVEVDYGEIRRAHEIDLQIADLDQEVIAGIKGGFAVPPEAIDQQMGALDPGESLQIPIAMDLRMIWIPRAGAYAATATVDQTITKRLTFRVVEAATWPPPPAS